MMRSRRFAFAIVLVSTVAGCACFESLKTPVPVAVIPEVSAPAGIVGIDNGYRVTDRLYRCAQPDAAGFAALEKAGVTTVINLRANHDDADAAKGTALKLIRVPVDTWSLDDRQVVAVMRAVRDAKGPVTIHCQHGADRTGTMIAMYRILYQGWSKDAALAEMTGPRFNYHTIWANLPKYIRNADIEALRREIDKPEA